MHASTCPNVPTSSACSSSAPGRSSSGRPASSITPGTQACKALRAEGLEVILVNSNPATIMTDPEIADRTYVEPLTPEVLAKIIEKERPDAVLPTVGGQTALNLAVALGEDGTLEKFGVELIGAQVESIKVAEDRLLFRDAMKEIGADVPESVYARSMAEAMARGRRARLPDHHPAVVHDGRRRRRHRLQHRGVQGDRRPRHRHEPGARGAARGVGDRLERVRARGDARQGGQLRRHLLDRERRPDGRAHRRQHHRRAGADADRSRVPAHARSRAAHHQPRRRRDRRLEHPVRDQPEERPDHRHRDEPARVALVGARLEGDRVPDREDRRQARARLSPRRDPQRHHPADAGVVRADHRLRRGQGAALGVREVPARRSHADHADEVGRRGDGDRPDVQGSLHEGVPLARARLERPAVHAARASRQRRPDRGRRGRGAAARAERADRSAHVGGLPRARPRLVGRGAPRADEDRSVVPDAVLAARRAGALGRPRRPARHVVRDAAHAQARRHRRSRARRDPRRRRGGGALVPRLEHGPQARLQAHRHLRRGVRVVHAVPLRHLRAGVRGRSDAARQGGHPRQRPEPHRAGDRVRLLLLPRRLRAPRGGLRDGDGQLQPGDRLHRLRHRRSPVLRAADLRGRLRRSSRASGRPAATSRSSCSTAGRRR